jgi:type II secretory pathway pseudopilin PulG
MKKLNLRGDTIIEVLIALSVIGAVIGGAYATASRSLNVGRQAQERAEATRVAESQVESLKALAGSIDSSGDIFDHEGDFCVNAGEVVQTGSSSGQDTEVAVLETGTASAQYNEECVFAPRYFTSISREDNTFTVLVRWERIGGGIDEIKMLYKAYPGSN